MAWVSAKTSKLNLLPRLVMATLPSLPIFQKAKKTPAPSCTLGVFLRRNVKAWFVLDQTTTTLMFLCAHSQRLDRKLYVHGYTHYDVCIWMYVQETLKFQVRKKFKSRPNPTLNTHTHSLKRLEEKTINPTRSLKRKAIYPKTLEETNHKP